MLGKRQVEHSIVVETTPDLAFEAVTRDGELREWFSDQAWTEIRPSGRYALHWNQGYHVEGKFVELEAPHHAVVTWWGTGEPGESKVKFVVEPVDEGINVTVIHDGFGPGMEWDSAVAEAEKGWITGLENLKSTLETGVDLRIARRPFLGIYLDQLTPERAAREGIAAEQGIYVNDTVEGSGARAAGIGPGNVIVSLGGVETPGFEELGAALRACQVGDTVDAELVRGQARETIQITLGSRPMEDVPDGAGALADLLAERYQAINAELEAAVVDVTEAEAERCPAEEEWSVKQTLAHLSIVERDYQTMLGNIALDGWLDSGSSNPTAMPARLAAALAVTSTLPGLVKRFFADESETVAFLRELPQETLAHKARFFRISQTILSLPGHTREHIEQIKRVVATVRD